MEDWAISGVPLSATPDLSTDLRVRGEHGEVQGRPNGRYKHYRLNALGLLGPETAANPPPGTTRILVLGSSETFGSTNAPYHDYVSQLRSELARTSSSFEVLSAATPGLTARSMRPMFVHWCSQFDADVVVVYTNPLFYLNIDQPAGETSQQPSPRRSVPTPESRMWQRLKEAIELPQWLVDLRTARMVANRRSPHGPGWVFTETPEAQLRYFSDDYHALITAICRRVPTVILVTHPVAVDNLADPGQRAMVERFLQHTPRAVPAVVLDFDREANEIIRTTARDNQCILLDLDAEITGDSAAFADLVHLNDAGAAQVAARLQEVLLSAARREAGEL